MSWKDQCPNRGPGLEHAHWKDCAPPAPHPADPSLDYQGRVHQYSQCCHCEATIGSAAAQPAAQSVALDLADHLFQPTMGNRCAVPGCGRTRDAHPTIVQAAPLVREDGSCNVAHESITAALLIGDGGLEWRRCPVCGTLVEPKLAGNGPTGNPNDPGRGDPTPRLLKRLQAWMGWVDFNGGR